MTEFRVTRYDPALRRLDGSFGVETWTSVSDIGRSFENHVLTQEEYLAVEDAYVEAIHLFMDSCNVKTLTLKDLEVNDESEGIVSLPADHRHSNHESYVAGAQLSGKTLDGAARLTLREQIWCRLEAPGGFFVHFGYDFYMYIGTPGTLGPPGVSSLLFVEEFGSPYHREE